MLRGIELGECVGFDEVVESFVGDPASDEAEAVAVFPGRGLSGQAGDGGDDLRAPAFGLAAPGAAYELGIISAGLDEGVADTPEEGMGIEAVASPVVDSGYDGFAKEPGGSDNIGRDILGVNEVGCAKMLEEGARAAFGKDDGEGELIDQAVEGVLPSVASDELEEQGYTVAGLGMEVLGQGSHEDFDAAVNALGGTTDDDVPGAHGR